MTARLSRFGTLVVCGVLLGACAQLIGLNDYDEEGGAGQSGEASGAKGGASAQGGLAGSSVSAGTGGSGGAAGGRGGTGSGGRMGFAGKGGTTGKGGSGDNGGESSGGAPDVGGTGGTGGTSVGGEAGAPSYDCASTVDITDLVLLPRDPSADPSTNSFGVQSPQIGDFADDELWVDFYSSARYDGEATGTFDLGVPPDNNYATCARCVWLGQDLGVVSDPTAYFYVKSGTMTVDPASLQMDGFPILSLDKITLIESTVDVEDTHVSRPVENPRCLYLEHAEINMAPPPPEWLCYPEYYGTGDGCDCGCGVIDPDCSSVYSGACDACGEDGACSTDTTYCDGIDPDDNSQCDTTPDWACSILRYGDGPCDCGCGVKDVDCSSSDPSVCVSCGDLYSCTTTASCAELDPLDNSKCVSP